MRGDLKFFKVLRTQEFNTLFHLIMRQGLIVTGDSFYFLETAINPIDIQNIDNEVRVDPELRTLYRNFKNSWDGYGGHYERNVIGALKQEFRYDEKCRRYKPVYDVKDLGVSLTANYLRMVNSVCRYSESFDGKDLNILSKIVEISADNLRSKIANKISKYSSTEVKKMMLLLFSVMMFRCSIGAIMEKEVISELEVLLEEKKGKWRVEAADKESETQDVDCWIINERTGRHFPVSIKNLGALSKETIDYYRNVLGKDVPEYYIGKHSQSSDLEIIRAKDLKHFFSKF